MLRQLVQRFHAERLPFGALAGILSFQTDTQAGQVVAHKKLCSCSKKILSLTSLMGMRNCAGTSLTGMRHDAGEVFSPARVDRQLQVILGCEEPARQANTHALLHKIFQGLAHSHSWLRL